MNFKGLSNFTKPDRDKQREIESLSAHGIESKVRLVLKNNVKHSVYYKENRMLEAEYKNPDLNLDTAKFYEFDVCEAPIEELTKFCPKCGQKYPEGENFCFDCACNLKEIRDIDVKTLDLNPKFTFKGSVEYSDFNEILTDENLQKISNGNFNIKEIVKDIKLTALKRFDGAIKENDIHLDSLSILDKIILFAKSFVDMEYKSYGPELGYYEFNKIYIDDRQLDALQITTLLHELSHYLVKEILTHILCKLLDCSKTIEIESIVTFILSYSAHNQLIDEYAAHSVESRFTLYGFQDYSSFLNIQNSIELPVNEIELLKTVGNSFSLIIKDILESFIDYDLLNEIKKQFRSDILDQPDYRNLKYENCELFTDEGLIKVVRIILADGFSVAFDNIETLESYNLRW